MVGSQFYSNHSTHMKALTKMRIGYARTSTTDKQQDTSIDGQVKQLQDAGCDYVISERKSAFKGVRDGWQELWSLVASGRLREVVVVDQSRMSRSGDDVEFLNACALQNVTVRALSGGVIENETYGGFVMSSIQSVFNEAQSRLTSVKVRDGMKRRREQGFYVCGKVPFGYEYDGEQLVPSAQNWEAARAQWDQLIEMEMNVSGWIRTSGMPWSPKGLRTWINNPILRGTVRGERNKVKALITAEEWSEAQRLLDARKIHRGSRTGQTHVFTSLVKCKSCGKSLHTVVREKINASTRLQCKSVYCEWHGRGIAQSIVRDQVIELLRSQSAAMAKEVDESIQDSGLAAECQEIAELKEKIRQLEELQSAGVPDLNGAIEKCNRELDALYLPTIGPDWSALHELSSLPGVLEKASDAELRVLVLKYISEIIYIGNPREVYVGIV